MKSNLYVALFFLALSAGSDAQQAPQHVDALIASPDIYSLLLENEHIRMLEYLIEPGEKEAWHTHPPKAIYVASGGKLRITTEDGDSFVVDENTGDTAWMNAVGRHYGENIGATPIRIVLMEVKSLADAPFEEASAPE